MACSFFRPNFAPWPFTCYHLQSSAVARPLHRRSFASRDFHHN